MALVDRGAVEEIGIPSMVLMENAALGLAEAVAGSFPDASSVAIYCGPGNNGGDGLALARHLAVRGYRVRCLLAFGGRETRGDAASQLAICRSMAPDLLRLDEIGPAQSPSGDRTVDLGEALAAGRSADLVVDALFGTGLGRPLEGQLAELVEGLNALPVPRLAVDLPSGLNGSRSDLFGPHLVADLTVTFAAPKPAQVFSPAADAVGELVVADLGIPPELLDRPWGEEPALHLVVGEEVAAWLSPRQAESHKGTYGHLLVVAGATGKSGAAILAARSAVRSGAGLVTVAVPGPIVQTVDLGSLESMSLALPVGEDPLGRLGEGAARAILDAAAGKDALALGPGLGQGDPVSGEIREAVLACELPLVLDADGLNAFAGRAGELTSRPGPTVLTPHPGELARLLDVETSAVVDDRLAFARRAARETGAVVVLKGHQSLTAAPDGAVHVNPTGNPGMATGGTGDVLTGLLGGLLAQGYEALEAAILGVYLHGLAGDLARDERGERGLAAGDLVEALPRAFETLDRRDGSA
jgi:NAD(P)H-hydrate epimerase